MFIYSSGRYPIISGRPRQGYTVSTKLIGLECYAGAALIRGRSLGDSSKITQLCREQACFMLRHEGNTAQGLAL
jgi:hypothetical protein